MTAYEKKLLAVLETISAQLDQLIEAKKHKLVPASPQPKSKLKTMLNIYEVVEIVDLSRTTIHRKEKAGTFPLSRQLSSNRRAWYLSDIQKWQKRLTTENPRRKQRKLGGR
jgi:predicted DNA-binding transcriptional regulator AlpA